jgi:hypothetical protein
MGARGYLMGLQASSPMAAIAALTFASIRTGDPSYRTVKGILAAGTEHEGVQPPLPGIDVPAWLRGPGAFGGDQR